MAKYHCWCTFIVFETGPELKICKENFINRNNNTQEEAYKIVTVL